MALHRESGTGSEDEAAVLEALGIDPDGFEPTSDLPAFLRQRPGWVRQIPAAGIS